MVIAPATGSRSGVGPRTRTGGPQQYQANCTFSSESAAPPIQGFSRMPSTLGLWARSCPTSPRPSASPDRANKGPPCSTTLSRCSAAIRPSLARLDSPPQAPTPRPGVPTPPPLHRPAGSAPGRCARNRIRRSLFLTSSARFTPLRSTGRAGPAHRTRGTRHESPSQTGCSTSPRSRACRASCASPWRETPSRSRGTPG